MDRAIRVASLLVLVVGAGVFAQDGQPTLSQGQVDVVEVIGCLSQADGGWILTKGSDPIVSKTAFTTPEAVKAAAGKPLGTRQYRLMGTSPFNPNNHEGHKIAVKGLLIKDTAAKDTRINVTSFQMVGEMCAK